MSTTTITVLATFRPKPDAVAQVLEVLDGMVEPTRAEPGNQIYDLYKSEEDDVVTFHLFEVYDDDAALQAHRDSAHYKTYRAAITDHLVAPIDVIVMAAVDVDR